MVDGFSTFRKNPRAKTLEWDPDCGDISSGEEIDTNCFIDPSDSSDSDPTGNAVRVGLSKGGIIAVAVVVPVVVIAAVVLACFLCGRRKRRPFGAVSAAGAATSNGMDEHR